MTSISNSRSVPRPSSKFVISDVSSKSKVSLSSTALGASLTPSILIVICAVVVCPALFVIVYVIVSYKYSRFVFFLTSV